MKRKGTKIKTSLGSKIFDVFNVCFMLVFSFVMIYPFWNQLVISFNEGSDTVKGGLAFLPRAFTVENYSYIFTRTNIAKGAVISVLRAVVGTTLTIMCTGLLGYITTIQHFVGKRFVRLVFIITMYFGGGLIPTFLLYSNLGLLDTFTVYWLPALFSATMAYYAMWVLGVVVFALAVYYTVKQL